MWAEQNLDANNYEWLDNQKSCITVNWFDRGKVGPLKTQGECGSCYAHSAVAAIETLAAQQAHSMWPDDVPVYSEQQIVDCSLIPNFGCMGGEPKYAFSYIREHGLAKASVYPYEDALGTCRYVPEMMKSYELDDFKIFEYPLNEDLAKLVCQGTVSVNFYINDCIKGSVIIKL